MVEILRDEREPFTVWIPENAGKKIAQDLYRVLRKDEHAELL